MRAVLAALLVVALYTSVVSAADDPTASLSGVTDLTPDNFDKIVNGGKHALVEFYAPWCGHCKHLVPEYKTLGETVAKDGALSSRIVVAKVNADEHRSLGERYGVKGFPTIKYFPRGKPATLENAVDYNGARNSDKFLEFLKEKLEEDKGFARVAEMDKLALKFIAEGANTASIIADAETQAGKASKEDKEAAALYVTFMKRALDKGMDYFAKEQARLERMMASGGVAAAKVTEMARKASVLSAFSPDAADEDDDVDEE